MKNFLLPPEETGFTNATLLPPSISAGLSIYFCSTPRFGEAAVVIVVLASKISSSSEDSISGAGGTFLVIVVLAPTISSSSEVSISGAGGTFLGIADCLVRLRGNAGARLLSEGFLMLLGAVLGAVNWSTAFFLALSRTFSKPCKM